MCSRFPTNLAALLACLFVTLRLSAQAPPLEIRGGNGDDAVEPGQIVTRNFIVENRAQSPLEVTEELELPAGWTRIAAVDAVFIAPSGEPQMRLISFSVPRNATAQQYDIAYRLRDRRNNAVLAETKLPVLVRPTGRLVVSLADKPTSVPAGDKATLSLNFFNRGNCAVNVALEWKVSPAAPVIAPAREFTVEAGAARDLALEVQTDDALSKRLLQLVQIKVLASWAGGGRATVPIETLTFEVVPQHAPKFDQYRHLPARLTTTFGWENGRAPGFQTELAGRGALDETGARRLDFMLRSPDSAGDQGSLRRQEEYGASYFSPLWDLHVGDRNFALSPLTQTLGNSRGLKYDWHPGPTSAGVFASQGRTEFDPHREAGGYVRRQFSGGWAAQANVLHSDAGTNGAGRNIYSLQGTWTLTNRLSLGVEGGLDDSAQSWSAGLGWRAELRGLLGDSGAYSLAHTFAGPEFHGAQSDSQSTSASLYVPLTERLRLTGNFRTYANNLDHDAARAHTSTDERVWRTGVRYRASRDTEVSLEYQDTRRRDTLAPADYDFAEQTVRVGVAKDFGAVRLDVSQEVGRAEDFLSGQVKPFAERTTASAVWRASARQSYSALASYGDSAMSVAAEKTMVASIGGNWQPTPATTVSANAAHEVNAETSRSKDSLNVSLGWTRANGHRISATARYARASDRPEPEAAVFVSYSIPLGIPVGRKRGFGTIQGSVLDVDSTTPAPLAKAIVRLNTGETTVTDRSGRYVVAGLKPGDYSVSVDSRSLGFGRVTAELIPETLVVKKDSVITLDVAVISAATLTVQLTIFEENLAPARDEQVEPAAPRERHRPAGGLAGEIVELHNDHETHRRQTNAKGEAVFANLRPGAWLLKTYDSALPANHILEQPERKLELKPAAGHTEVVRVLPRKRTLKLIDGGALN